MYYIYTVLITQNGHTNIYNIKYRTYLSNIFKETILKLIFSRECFFKKLSLQIKILNMKMATNGI